MQRKDALNEPEDALVFKRCHLRQSSFFASDEGYTILRCSFERGVRDIFKDVEMPHGASS